MRAVDIIRKKRDGHPLSPEEIEGFVCATTRRQWPDYQVAALLMAIVLRGMDATETAAAYAHIFGKSVITSEVNLSFTFSQVSITSWCDNG